MSRTKKFKFSFRTVLSILTIFLVAFVVWRNWGDIVDSVEYISKTNIFVLLLLIPEQLFMYYSCGQIFFSYMSHKKHTKKLSNATMMRVALELNFVNHAVPAGGFGGLGYVTWRLKEFGVTPGQASFMYLLRYAITILSNQFQTIVAIIVMALSRSIPAGGVLVIWLSVLMCCGIIGVIAVIIVIASRQRHIQRFSDFISRFVNKVVKIVTFGRKTSVLKAESVVKYFTDIHHDLITARKNKKTLIRPFLWGVIYSFFEIATYWIVACSLGFPWILPQIMIGEAVGSVLGAIVPYGIYELGMTGIMVRLGVDLSVALPVVVMTRVIVLGSTIITGYGFYQYAISKIGKDKLKESEPTA